MVQIYSICIWTTSCTLWASSCYLTHWLFCFLVIFELALSAIILSCLSAVCIESGCGLGQLYSAVSLCSCSTCVCLCALNQLGCGLCRLLSCQSVFWVTLCMCLSVCIESRCRLCRLLSCQSEFWVTLCVCLCVLNQGAGFVSYLAVSLCSFSIYVPSRVHWIRVRALSAI